MFPTLSEMAKYGLLEGNPIEKMKKEPKTQQCVSFECKKCHYYIDKLITKECPNCHLKI